MASLSFLLLASFLLSPTPFLSSGFAVPLLIFLDPRVRSLFFLSFILLFSPTHFFCYPFSTLLSLSLSSVPSYYLRFYLNIYHPFHPFSKLFFIFPFGLIFRPSLLSTSAFRTLIFPFFLLSVQNKWVISERKCSIVCTNDPSLIIPLFLLIPRSDLQRSYSCIVVLKYMLLRT